MEATAQAASSAARGRTVTGRLPLWVLIGACLGILAGTTFGERTKQLFPKARIVPLETYDDIPAHPELDAAVWSLDQARAWASGHSGFSAVAASGMGAPLLFAYFLQPSATTLSRYLNTWLSFSGGERLSRSATRLLDRRQAAP